MATLEGFVAYSRSREWVNPRVCQKITNIYRRIDNQFVLDQADQIHFVATLFHAVQFFRPEQVVQTGTFTGVSLLAMLLGAENGNGPFSITSIDPEPDKYLYTSNPVDLARSMVKHIDRERAVTFLRGYSAQAPPGAQAPGNILKNLPRQFDMLVVDGDHSFRGAYDDLVDGSRTLRPGIGMVLVHDYNGIPEVRAAVDTWIQRSDMVRKAMRTPHACGLVISQLDDGMRCMHE